MHAVVPCWKEPFATDFSHVKVYEPFPRLPCPGETGEKHTRTVTRRGIAPASSVPQILQHRCSMHPSQSTTLHLSFPCWGRVAPPWSPIRREGLWGWNGKQHVVLPSMPDGGDAPCRYECLPSQGVWSSSPVLCVQRGWLHVLSRLDLGRVPRMVCIRPQRLAVLLPRRRPCAVLGSDPLEIPSKQHLNTSG